MQTHNGKKEQQVENLVNLVEKHTRTQRHLEQYSNIGRKDNKERARNKQDIREGEIENLKSKIVSSNNESKIEQVQSLVDKYKNTQAYMEDNYEKISKNDLENIQNKQMNRKEQIENLSKNIYEEQN